MYPRTCVSVAPPVMSVYSLGGYDKRRSYSLLRDSDDANLL